MKVQKLWRWHICVRQYWVRKGAVQYEQGSIERGFCNGGRDELARFFESDHTENPSTKEFSELYGEEPLALKIGRRMMVIYKAAPQKVKATIIEGLVMQYGRTSNDLEEGLGITRWQWNNAQLAMQ